jgi:predicted DNA-binding protein with PD1-like motif
MRYSRITNGLKREGMDMRYEVGRPGRVIVARFDDGDEILTGLKDMAIREEIKAAVFYLVGGLSGARIVVGPQADVMPPVPVWKEITESHEAVGVGTIFWGEGEPHIHFHGAFGKRESVKSGCLRESAHAFIVMEAVVIEINGVRAARASDPRSGMMLLNI